MGDFKTQNVKTVQDIRAIIQSLKMSNLSFVESDANDEIQQMIKALPSAETIFSLAKDELRALHANIKNILRLIDVYSKRNQEYSVRYKTKTGLPPRYKLDPSTIAKSDVFCKISTRLDELGYNKIANRILKCANQNINNDLIKTSEILVKAGFEKEALLMNEAAWRDYVPRMEFGPRKDRGRSYDASRLGQVAKEFRDWMSSLNEYKKKVEALVNDFITPEYQEKGKRFVNLLDQTIKNIDMEFKNQSNTSKPATPEQPNKPMPEEVKEEAKVTKSPTSFEQKEAYGKVYNYSDASGKSHSIPIQWADDKQGYDVAYVLDPVTKQKFALDGTPGNLSHHEFSPEEEMAIFGSISKPSKPQPEKAPLAAKQPSPYKIGDSVNYNMGEKTPHSGKIIRKEETNGGERFIVQPDDGSKPIAIWPKQILPSGPADLVPYGTAPDNVLASTSFSIVALS